MSLSSSQHTSTSNPAPLCRVCTTVPTYLVPTLTSQPAKTNPTRQLLSSILCGNDNTQIQAGPHTRLLGYVQPTYSRVRLYLACMQPCQAMSSLHVALLGYIQPICSLVRLYLAYMQPCQAISSLYIALLGYIQPTCRPNITSVDAHSGSSALIKFSIHPLNTKYAAVLRSTINYLWTIHKGIDISIDKGLTNCFLLNQFTFHCRNCQ